VFCCGLATFVISNGKTYACGSNGFGQLGLGNLESRSFLTEIKKLQGLNVRKIDGGLHHTLFLTEDGILFGAGKNFDGQLGLGSSIRYCVYPMPISNGKSFIDIACGVSSFNSFAVDENHALWVAGQNQYGQLTFEDSTILKFTQTDLKTRKCLKVAAGCQFTIVLLSEK
jgi:alpha-tubulin suppressor-like RCC1 family protein